MEFPPKVLYALRFQASPAQFPADEVTAAALRDKLAALAGRHEQVKIAYHQLHSQIKVGLIEAGEVFASLAIPLMKLVGLKTTEMETEGRFAAFVLDPDIRLEKRDHVDIMRSPTEITRNGFGVKDPNNQSHSSKEENYAAKVERAGKEILDKQQRQLIQLVQILRHIEREVNSHQDNILETIDHHRTFFHEFVRKAICYMNMLRSQSHDTFPVTVKLLRVMFNNISGVLGSVDGGVKDLMQALAEQMCNPMAKYVNNLSAEIKHGPCVQLMGIVNEMERASADTKQELEYARASIRTAEETKIEVLLRLKKAEEQVRKMTGSLGFLRTSQKHPAKPATALKRIGIEESQENDEKLLWELLRKKRKQQEPESPIGTKELITETDNKPKPSYYHRSMKMLINPKTTRSDVWIPLGLSPTVRAAILR